MAIDTIEHVTITTGHRSMQRRSRYKQAAVDDIRSRLAESGDLGNGFTLNHIPAGSGAHAYAILFDGLPMVTCILCVDDEASQYAWSAALIGAPAERYGMARPVSVPWLASVITINDDALMADMSRIGEALRQVSDLSMLVALAIVD